MNLKTILNKNTFIILIAALWCFYPFGDCCCKDRKNYDPSVIENREIKFGGILLDKNGIVKNEGYSIRKKIKLNYYDTKKLFGMKFWEYRIKKFEHYAIFFDNFLIQVGVSHLQYAASAFIILYDFEKKELYHENIEFYPYFDIFPHFEEEIDSCAGKMEGLKNNMKVAIFKSIK